MREKRVSHGSPLSGGRARGAARRKARLFVSGLTAAAIMSGAVTAQAAMASTPTVNTNYPIAGITGTPDGRGYWEVASDGGVFSFGTAQFYGSAASIQLAAPVVGITSTPDGKGYWLVAADGGVFAFGDAGYFGSMGGKPLNSPVVGMSATPDGGGYWLTAKDGGVFAYGDAQFAGSMGGKPMNAPVVGIAGSGGTTGYWLAGADGGIFAFNAPFSGSMGGKPLNAPMAGIARSGSGTGYWMVGADGGVFGFGGAPVPGSMGGKPLNAPVVGMAGTPSGNGYWLVASDGGVFAFGDAPYLGRAVLTSTPPPPPPGGQQMPANLMLSTSGAAFIAAFEGFSAVPYNDPSQAQNCTIGYGHLIHAGPCTSTDKQNWGSITVQQGQALLQSDVNTRFVPALRTGIPATPLTQTQFDALIDWIYNEGAGVITGSSSVRNALRVSPPQYSAVPQDLMNYVSADGKKLCGLYRRRISEGNLWSTGSYARLSPACPPGYN